MSFLLSVATHPTADIAKPSIFIEDKSTGDRTIIGNVPAGLQRKCNEMKLKTSRLSNIFLSGILDWKSVSGLPGFILTISDQGVKSLGIYHSGNKVIQYMISCWRYFIFRFGMDIDVKDIDTGIEKGHVLYSPVNIAPETDYGSNDNKEMDHEKLAYLVKNIFPVQKDPAKPFNSKRINNVTLPTSLVNPRVTTNWIFTPNPIRGKFLVQNAKALNCEVKHFKTLCENMPVTLDDGTVVKPEQVLEPTRYFQPSLVLDIPGEEYLEKTIKHDWQNLKPNSLPYGVVFHFIDESIAEPLSRPEYIDFINSFGPSTLHFISHSSYCPNTINFLKSFRYTLKLKTLMSNFFPLPKWSNDSILKLDEKILPNVLPLLSGQQITVKAAEPCVLEESTKFGDEHCQFNTESCQKLYDTEIEPSGLKNIATKDEFTHMLQEGGKVETLKTTVDPLKPLKDQVETLILGTGSALPAMLKNVLCNLVRIPYVSKDGTMGFRTIVLDAGENSFGSLKRLYKNEELDMLMDELKMVYLSHLHADHHLGVVDFIREWNARQDAKFGKEGRSDVLFVVTPWQYELFVEELNKIDQFANTKYIRYVSCEEFMEGNKSPMLQQFPIEALNVDELQNISNVEYPFVENEEKKTEIYHSLGLESIKTCAAFHCEYAYSVYFNFKLNMQIESDPENIDGQSNFFRISYSGDTRPKAQFAFMASGSDLLIHESTLEDEKYKDALDKRHSTTSEAVHVGIIMQAKKIILTHFSQRYKSFTCSDLVYKRLKAPTTKEDINPSVVQQEDRTIMPKLQGAIVENENVPIELQSPIFAHRLSDNAKSHAKSIEVLFAFDNMKVQYDEISQQRKVFESQGKMLEFFFFADQDDFELDVFEEQDSKNKGKKKDAGKGKGKGKSAKSKNSDKSNVKKRKVSPAPI